MKYITLEQQAKHLAHIREWQRLHPEKVKSYLKKARLRRIKNGKHRISILKYRSTHRDVINRQQREWRKANKEKVKEMNKRWKKKNPLKVKFRRYKYSAKYRWYEFALSYQEFLSKIINTICKYCGADKGIGIDRVNNLIGYTNENTVPCCWECNRLKKTMSKDKFINLCIAVAEKYNNNPLRWVN